MAERKLIGIGGREWGAEWTFSRNGRIEHSLVVSLIAASPIREPGAVGFGFHREVSGHLVHAYRKPIVTGVGTVRASKDGECLVTIEIGAEVIDLDPEECRSLLARLWREAAQKVAKRAIARFPEQKAAADTMIGVVEDVLERWESQPISEIPVSEPPAWIKDLARRDLFDGKNSPGSQAKDA